MFLSRISRFLEYILLAFAAPSISLQAPVSEDERSVLDVDVLLSISPQPAPKAPHMYTATSRSALVLRLSCSARLPWLP